MTMSCSTSCHRGRRQATCYPSMRMCSVIILAMMQSIAAFHMKPPVGTSQRSLIQKDKALHNYPVDKENPDQHFRSLLLFPWTRPLLVRPESQPERGFWLLEQARVCPANKLSEVVQRRMVTISTLVSRLEIPHCCSVRSSQSETSVVIHERGEILREVHGITTLHPDSSGSFRAVPDKSCQRTTTQVSAK